MRILALSHLYPHEGERRYGIFVARQLQAMADAGAEITLLVLRPSVPALLELARGRSLQPATPLINYPGVEAISVPFVSLPGLWFSRWIGRFAYMAARRTARELHAAKPFDVIYSTQIIVGGDAGRRLSKDLKIPTANLAIGSDINIVAKYSPTIEQHYARIVTELDGTLTCGQSLKDEVLKQRPSPPFLDTLCVYGVVDLDRFKPLTGNRDELRSTLQLSTERTTILYVGYLRREKGLIELIQAFSEIHRCHPHLNLVLCGAGEGAGEDEAAIRQAAKESGACEAIQFVGSVEPEKVCQYMQASDLFTLPSYNEGMPNVVMEAMACGLPVVCTNVGGLRAALSTSKGAKLVPPREVEPLRNALESVLTDDALRREMSQAARQTAVEEFDVRRSAQRILDYLAKVADSSKA